MMRKLPPPPPCTLRCPRCPGLPSIVGASALLVLALVLSILPGQAGAVMVQQVADQQRLWPPDPDGYTRINICFDVNSKVAHSSRVRGYEGMLYGRNPNLKEIADHIQVALSSSWEINTSIRFTGFGPCLPSPKTDYQKTIKIYLDREAQAQSPLGYRDVVSNGENPDIGLRPWGTHGGDPDACIQYNASTARMEYSFDCVEQYAIHEVGHALGLSHEWWHPSATPACRAMDIVAMDRAAQGSNVIDCRTAPMLTAADVRAGKGGCYSPNLIYYDVNSIMTYGAACADQRGVRFGNPRPSVLDLQGIRELYPPPPGAPRCIEAYEQSGYRGTMYPLACAQTPPHSTWNDRSSSLRIPQGYQARCCTDVRGGQCAGLVLMLSGDVPAMNSTWDHAISYIELLPIPGLPTAAPLAPPPPRDSTASPPPASGQSASTVAPTPLPLSAGWSSYGGAFGAVTYMAQGGVVLLSGIARPAGDGIGNELVGVLPVGVRPSKTLIFATANHDGTARVDVQSNGEIRWRTSPGQEHWVSLSGIQFPLDAGQAIPAGPDCRPYGGGLGDLTAHLTDDVVYVTGVSRCSAMPLSLLATLPPGYRPDRQLIFNLDVHGKSARVDVSPSGEIRWVAGSADVEWVSLTGIRFPKRTGPGLQLVSPWGSYGGAFGEATIQKSASGVVHISGTVRGGVSGLFALLPPDMVPSTTLVFLVNSHGQTARIDVTPNGTVLRNTPPTDVGWLSLSGISFRP